MDELAMLEAAMRKQQLRVWPRTIDSETLALPSLVDTFVRLTTPGYLPTQEAYLRAIVARAPELPELGVRARASRSYPALVRQLHFATALRTRSAFQGVHWVPALDMLGIDLLVLHHGYALGVALSIKTDRAASWKAVKDGRHPALAGLEMLHIDVDPDRAEQVGPFYIHPLTDVFRVERAMEKLMGATTVIGYANP